MKKVCQPLVCAEIASQHSFSDTPWWLIQTFLLGREAENVTLSHSPTFWPLSTWGQVHHKILLAAAYSAGHEITTWLVCLVTCQKYVSETAFSFTVENVVFPFQPLSGSCHPAIERYLKTKLILTSIHVALKLWSVRDLSCLSFRCLKTIAAKGKSSIYMYFAKMLLDVMSRLFWDDSRLVWLTNNIYPCHFSSDVNWTVFCDSFWAKQGG